VAGWLLEAWKAYVHRAATYQTRVLLTFVYAIILGPAAIVARLFGAQLLDVRSGSTSTLLVRPRQDTSLDGLRRQF
jgi:hypothetical protein